MDSALAPLPVIRPITDMRVALNEVCAQATETREPIVLTKNGVPAYVLIDSDAFEEERLRQREMIALREAEIEEKYHPEGISAEAMEQHLEKLFAAMGVEYARA